MFLGKVIGDIDSGEEAGENSNSRLKMVQKLDLYRNASGPSTIAVDFIGADDGDIVIVGSNSASTNTLARNSLPSPDNMIMGILDNSQSTRVRRHPAR